MDESNNISWSFCSKLIALVWNNAYNILKSMQICICKKERKSQNVIFFKLLCLLNEWLNDFKITITSPVALS